MLNSIEEYDAVYNIAIPYIREQLKKWVWLCELQSTIEGSNLVYENLLTKFKKEALKKLGKLATLEVIEAINKYYSI